uniref:Nucleoporin GLE1 n=1 Tax=Panagrellus redivivus TaxID=6233 RepID=A0A7E4UMY9_PANRE
MAVATPAVTITIFVFIRLYQLCNSLAQFRSVILQLLGYDPTHVPSNVIPLDKLGKTACKIANIRSSKRRADLEAYEKDKVDLTQIGFLVPADSTFTDMPLLPPIIDCYGEPLPKVRRTSIETGQPPTASEFERQLRNETERSKYWQKQYLAVKSKLEEFEVVNKINEELRDQLASAKITIEKLNYQLQNLENDLEKTHASTPLPSVLPEVDRVFKMKTSRGTFISEAQMLFAQLAIDFQVAETKVGGVISCVANFLKVIVEAVPSARTVGRSIHVASAAMAHQILEVLNRPEVEFTLQSDETTKKYNKIQAYAATYLNDQTQELERIFFEVEGVSNKSSQRQFEALQAAIEGLAEKAQASKSTVFNNFILQVKNMMGDQARTKIKFAEILTNYREICKRTIDPEFDHLPEEEQNLFLQTNLLFCFLHLTSNTTPHVLRVLKEDEMKQTGNSVGAKSTVETLLIELSRYFGPRTAAKYSQAGEWKRHCESKGIKHGKIDSYSKSRFHSLFIIAVQVLFNKDNLIAFISDHFDDGGIRDFLLEGLKNELIIKIIEYGYEYFIMNGVLHNLPQPWRFIAFDTWIFAIGLSIMNTPIGFIYQYSVIVHNKDVSLKRQLCFFFIVSSIVVVYCLLYYYIFYYQNYEYFGLANALVDISDENGVVWIAGLSRPYYKQPAVWINIAMMVGFGMTAYIVTVYCNVRTYLFIRANKTNIQMDSVQRQLVRVAIYTLVVPFTSTAIPILFIPYALVNTKISMMPYSVFITVALAWVAPCNAFVFLLKSMRRIVLVNGPATKSSS